jgi:hypothetical protein
VLRTGGHSSWSTSGIRRVILVHNVHTFTNREYFLLNSVNKWIIVPYLLAVFWELFLRYEKDSKTVISHPFISPHHTN